MTRRFLLAALTVAGLLPAVNAADPPARSIERINAKINGLLAVDAKVEELGGEFKWAEGPVWDKAKNRLLFTDIPNNRVVAWSQADGFSDFIMPSGFTGKAKFDGKEPGANGLAFDKTGVLHLCQHGDRCIAKYVEGKFVPLATKYDGKRLNSPNDLVFHSNGDIYFTDPPYGLPKGMDDKAKELDFQGVYRLKASGELTLLTKEMSRPNGIALSPDEKTLYVANSDNDKAPIWKSFPVKADGSIGEGKVFFDAMPMVKAKRPGAPDGMKVDSQGNVWATGPGGVFIFDPDGRHLGTIVTNTPTANCGWGDDGTTLYMTANDRLIRIKTKVKGIGF